MFLGFANLYKKFIKNFSRIATLLTLMLQTTGKIKSQSILANTSKKNQEVSNSTTRADSNGVGKNIKNLSTVINLAKFKKSDLIKLKKLDLPKTNSTKVNFRTDFLTSRAKKAFIYLQKPFIKALILHHFDMEYYFLIETNALGYAIGKVLSRITLDQCFSNHVTYKNLDFSNCKISH